MTSLLSPLTGARPDAEVRAQLSSRRPLVPTALAYGVVAAAAPLLILLAVGVAGWFLADSGAHGAPSDGLRTGALAWLMAHGSGVQIGGVAVTMIPLGLSLGCAWATWRCGVRLGQSVSGHGPDADAITDGERDLTVPIAGAMFGTGYVVVAVVTGALAASPATSPSVPAVVVWSMAQTLLVAAPAIAVGSGRASVWLTLVPETLRAAARVCRGVLLTWLAIAAALFLVSFLMDWPTAANVGTQLDLSGSDAVVLFLGSLVLVPNAVLFAGAYAAGPGFAVGTATTVAPSGAVLGPLPLFPMLAALPDDGAAPGFAPWLVVLAPISAAVVVVLVQRRTPTLRYDEAAIRACGGAIAAAVCFTLLAALSGGSVGPGRMRDLGPFVGDVLLHSVTAFGLGAVLAALAMTWWQRRDLREVDDSVSGA